MLIKIIIFLFYLTFFVLFVVLIVFYIIFVKNFYCKYFKISHNNKFKLNNYDFFYFFWGINVFYAIFVKKIIRKKSINKNNKYERKKSDFLNPKYWECAVAQYLLIWILYLKILYKQTNN